MAFFPTGSPENDDQLKQMRDAAAARQSGNVAAGLAPNGYLRNDAFSENTTGSFGSGRAPQPKRSGFPAIQPTAPAAQPIMAEGVGTAPASPIRGMKVDDSVVQARISGVKQLRGQSAAEMQAQNDFDRRNGFTPTHSDDDIARIAGQVNPAQQPGAPLVNSNGQTVGARTRPLDLLNNPPSIASEPLPSLGNTLLGVPSGQEVPPGAAVQAGQATGSAVRSAVNAIPRGPVSGFESFNPAYSPEKPIIDLPGAIGRGFGVVKRFAGNLASNVTGFASGFRSGAGGDNVAAGVSNATAAQFQKPTQANPVPVTPTSPVANIDKTTESLGRFGMSDDQFNRRKFAFAGQF